MLCWKKQQFQIIIYSVNTSKHYSIPYENTFDTWSRMNDNLILSNLIFASVLCNYCNQQRMYGAFIQRPYYTKSCINVSKCLSSLQVSNNNSKGFTPKLFFPPFWNGEPMLKSLQDLNYRLDIQVYLGPHFVFYEKKPWLLNHVIYLKLRRSL